MNRFRWLVQIVIALFFLGACNNDTNHSEPIKPSGSDPTRTLPSTPPNISNSTAPGAPHSGLTAMWQHPISGLNWGAIITEGSPWLSSARATSPGMGLPVAGWLRYEAGEYCRDHNARLPTLADWRDLLQAVGAQIDAEVGQQPSNYTAPNFLASFISSLTPINQDLLYLWLEDETNHESADNMTIDFYVANSQTGGVYITGHRSPLAFSCVW